MGIITALLKNVGISQYINLDLNISWLVLVVFAILAYVLVYLPYKKFIDSGEIGAEETEDAESGE